MFKKTLAAQSDIIHDLLVPDVAEVLDVTEYKDADCGTLYQL